FLLQADGTVRLRLNDHYLEALPGRDTHRFKLEPAPVRFSFAPQGQPTARYLQDSTLPICETTWETNGLRTVQTAFVTALNGSAPDDPVPPADTFVVLLTRLTISNTSSGDQAATLPISYFSNETQHGLRIDEKGVLWLGNNVRGQILTDKPAVTDGNNLIWNWKLAPGESKSVLIKL